MLPRNEIKTKLLRLYGPSVLSGFLTFLSFPRAEFYFLAWIALVPLLVCLHGKNGKAAFKNGITFGLIYFFGSTYWIYHSIHKYGSIPLIPSLLLVVLLSLYLSLYPGFFSFLYTFMMRRTSLPTLFVAPVLWTTLEFIRSYALTGFPWSSLGYSQFRFLPFIQIADITGVYGISFLLVAFNGAIADVILLKTRRAERPLYPLFPTVTGFVLFCGILTATFSYGFFRLHQTRPGTPVKVAIVQGNIEQDRKWDPAYQQEVTDVYKSLSSRLTEIRPDMIVWPETALPFIFATDRERTSRLVEFQRNLNAYLLFGSILARQGAEERTSGYPESAPLRARAIAETERFTNSAVLLDRDGNISYTYDKIHLVPFGEYVPLRSLLFFVDKLAFGVGDYLAGTRYTRAVTPFGSFGTLICYEIIFPGLVRKFYIQGGDFIVTITNDAWFGMTNGPFQHFSMGVFRAVENRKPVVRAANSGISGFIGSDGQILATTGLFERRTLIREIKTDRTLTLYTKYGDIFSYVCIVSALLLLIKRLTGRG